MSEQEKVQVTINGLLQDLKDGLTRDDIAAKYGLTKADVKRIFQNPKLKNKKTIKPREEAWILVDDTVEGEQPAPVLTVSATEDEITVEVEETVEEEQDNSVEESDDVFSR